LWKNVEAGSFWKCKEVTVLGKRHKIANLLSIKVGLHGTGFPDGISRQARSVLFPAMFSVSQTI
jgi:hypothetical protein